MPPSSTWMPDRSFLEGYTILVVSYSEEVVDESEDVEKCIKEGTTHHTSKVLADKSKEWPRALGGSLLAEVEVPLDGIARHDVVDYIARLIYMHL